MLGLAALLCACGGGADPSPGPEPAGLSPAVPLPADPLGEAAGLLDFGRVEVGRNAVSIVYLANTGDSPLLLEPPAPVGPFFATVPAGGLAVAPGARVPLELTFVPVAAGPAEALLVLRAGEHELSLRLVGEGVAAGPCVLSAAPLSFGEVPVSTAKLGRVEVRATGEGRCVVEDVVVEGEGFSQGPGVIRGVTLLPGGAAVPVMVRFQPEEPGPHRGTLRVLAGPASLEVELGGIGR